MHVNPPSVLLHVDCAWQLCLLLLHSSTSVRKQYLQYFILFLWFKCLSLLWKGWTQVKARVRAWEHVSWLISQLILHKKNSIEDFRVFPSWFFLYLRVKFTKGVSTLAIYRPSSLSNWNWWRKTRTAIISKTSICHTMTALSFHYISPKADTLSALNVTSKLAWSMARIKRRQFVGRLRYSYKQNQTNSRLIQTGLLLWSYNLFEFMSPLTFPWFITN